MVTQTGENLGNFPVGFFMHKEDAQEALANNSLMGFVKER